MSRHHRQSRFREPSSSNKEQSNSRSTAFSSSHFSITTQLSKSSYNASAQHAKPLNNARLSAKAHAAFGGDDSDDGEATQSVGGRYRAVHNEVPVRIQVAKPVAPILLPVVPVEIEIKPPIMQPSIESSNRTRRRRWDVQGETGQPPLISTPTVANIPAKAEVKIEQSVPKPEEVEVPRKRRRRFNENPDDNSQSFECSTTVKAESSTSKFVPVPQQPSSTSTSKNVSAVPTVTPVDLAQQEKEVAELRKVMQARAIALKALERIAPNITKGAVDDGVRDEDIEPSSDGTWEHKARALEMQKTADLAKQQTVQAEGKHHMANYLPPEEQATFMKQLIAARKGEPIDTVAGQSKEEYADNKLNEANKGFQLLQSMGWAGGGLGATGQGITAPVSSGRAIGDTQGLGVASTSSDGDNDIYSVYRQRMMQAYKHRPNPMNNPRRQYY